MLPNIPAPLIKEGFQPPFPNWAFPMRKCTEKIYIFVVIKYNLHETQFFLPVHPDFSMGFLTS